MNGLLPPDYQMYMQLLSSMSGQNPFAPPSVGSMPQQQMMQMLMQRLFGMQGAPQRPPSTQVPRPQPPKPGMKQ